MQTFQTRQILAIIKVKISRENSIFNVTLHEKNKMDPSFTGIFCCCVEQTSS